MTWWWTHKTVTVRLDADDEITQVWPGDDGGVQIPYRLWRRLLRAQRKLTAAEVAVREAYIRGLP